MSVFTGVNNAFMQAVNAEVVRKTIPTVQNLQLALSQGGNVIKYRNKLNKQLLRIKFPQPIDLNSLTGLNDLIVRLRIVDFPVLTN